ncbi:MAG: methyltransferase [Bryobacteraceae bacterium]
MTPHPHTRYRRYWFPKHYADEVQRLRVPLGFVMVAIFAWRADPQSWSLIAGGGIAAIGLLLRAWAAGHLAKNQILATTGPFGHVRNPLYIGTLTVAMGVALAAREVWLAILFAAAFVFVYLPAVELEEQHLRALFSDYADYAEEVPMLAPRWKTAYGGGRFRWALWARNQEYQALLGLSAGFAYLAWRAGVLAAPW